MDTPSPAYYAQQLVQAPLIASFFDIALYGIACVQTFFYFQTYPDDPLLMKLLVAVLWVLESLHSAFTISFNNSYLIDNFGNVLGITLIPWDLLVDCEIGFVTILVVNLFFTWRIWKFSKMAWAAWLLTSISVARFVLATVSTMLGFVYTSRETFKDHAYVPMVITMGIAVVEDTLMALILAYYLRQKRSGSIRTHQLVNRLLAYTVATGGFTSVFALMELIALLVSPNSILYLSFVLVQVKIYANSALLSLNLRQYQRKARGDTEEVGLHGFSATPEHTKALSQSVTLC